MGDTGHRRLNGRRRLWLSANLGLASAHEVSAAEQLQKSFPRVGLQPLPAGQGGRTKASGVGITDSEPVTFFVIGDHGGIKAPSPQNAVS